MIDEGKVVSTEKQKEMIHKIFDELFEIYENRSGRYGGTVIHELGLKGRYSDMFNKNFRLYSELWQEDVEDWELDNIYEHARDLANYTIFLMLQIKAIKEGKVKKK